MVVDQSHLLMIIFSWGCGNLGGVTDSQGVWSLQYMWKQNYNVYNSVIFEARNLDFCMVVNQSQILMITIIFLGVWYCSGCGSQGGVAFVVHM